MSNMTKANVKRGFICFENRHYFSIKLRDITKPVLIEPISREEIKVFDMGGAFICTAEIDENKRAAFPFSL
ncbi:Uncharacterised protein [Rodentibacter pneumotropicus]|uniref:Transposase-like Mu C-terminal domain-containing protein n=1 Tax=Rodentibacter pneumotropicus TaxID=758 RepID=A0A3S4U7I6_9PAST|nr:Uncharacterised protein [Rodentibacter pneumotropicus]